ncbi:MAG: membrane dipeptidase [Phenylobacterium sp.]|uniref:dipeptidase n=1 Tax=Phenylobacterium sp. TaxID=1871053 RepID=UPI002735EF37|nr:membrane dipeptidase [Phenylobacterium sp.]MDP3174663.1 membrane dipeptidase [Phenylobacterium sp.]
MTDSDALERARDLHREIVIFDGHLDIPSTFGGPGQAADADGPGQFDLVKARRGGLSGVSIAAAAPLARANPAGVASGRAAHEAGFAAIHAMAADFPDQVAIASTPADFREIVASGRLAVVPALQNAAPFDGRLEAVQAWRARGVQILALAFIGNNAFADSARPYPFAGDFDNGGLSDLGRKAVALANDLGLALDASQLSAEALRDLLAESRTPVIATHSAPRGMLDKRRNLTDAEMRAIADGGGLVNIVGFGPYLVGYSPDQLEGLRDLWMKYGLTDCQTMDDAIFHRDTAGWDDEDFWEFLHEFHVVVDMDNPTVGVSHLVDAIDYAVELIGIDHVGISSDFNHGGGLIDWRDAGRRGYPKADIAKLWGENFLRIWGEIQASARVSAIGPA